MAGAARHALTVATTAMELKRMFDLPDLCFRDPPATATWVQFDIGLVRHDGDARPSARRLFDTVMPWWERALRAGHVMNGFFMRKPPDVRLRFLATAAAPLATLEADLAGLVSARTISRCEFGTYVAEAPRFGGAAVMPCVHALFTLDTFIWYGLDACERRGERMLPGEDWLAAVFEDLFRAACGPRTKDAWQRLAAHVAAVASASPVPPLLPPSLDVLQYAANVSATERTLAAIARAGNARFGSALRQLAPTLPVSCPPAEVAATAAFFTFNRHGFAGERSRPVVARVLAGLD